MQTVKNQTLATVIALAGSTEAGLVAAFSDLQRAVLMFVKSGTRNALEDTRTDLQTMRGTRAKNVLAAVESAYAAANVEFSTHKRAHPDAEGMATAIALDARLAFEAADKVASDARKAKAAETKAAKEKAAKALTKAAKSVEPLAKALTLADALEAIGAACAAGDEQALNGVQSLAETYFDKVAA